LATNKLNICLASSEIAPLAKTGGLADVTAALSAYLHDAGHDARVLVPRYRRIDEAGVDIEPVDGLTDLSLRIAGHEVRYAIDRTTLPGSSLPVYLLRFPHFYDRPNIYTQEADEHLRFVLLSRAAIELCQHTGFRPDIFHCHDWQTALIPLYLKSVYAWDRLFADTKTVLTIHNIGYQGMFPAQVLPQLDLDGAEHHLHQDDLKEGVVNFLKTGVLYAQLITTVSPTYAREIMGEDYGMGLNDILQRRASSVVGILNGVDYGEWDPATDTLIPANYTADDLSGKAICKDTLLDELGLAKVDGRPLVGIVSRLVGQKGFSLMEELLPRLLHEQDLSLAVLGSGEPRFENFFASLQDHFRNRVCFYRGFSNKLAHWIEAGSDMFLMPSHYEPCGLNQMYSLRYGTVPVVRETGGLADSVEQIDRTSGGGTGVLFRDYNAAGLAWALERAFGLYADQPLWRRVMTNGMAKDFSWERQGARYVELFRQLTGQRQ
jgi:starch synthase